jgi:protein TonB
MSVRPLPLAPELPAATPSTVPASAVMVDVVVLSGDVPLYDAIRLSVGERNPVWRARSAEEAVDLLMTGRCGVLLIDMAAVSTQPATLIEQIVDQFPEVVVVVAGRREDESVLAGLISDGLVYRFMHKPLSPKRAGMFLNAAMRSHVERRAGRQGDPLLPLARELRSRVDPRKWLFVGGGLLLFLLLIAAFLVSRHRPDVQQPPAATAAGAAVPLADPVLSRARAALAAGRYEAPPGRNALDLYAAALLTRPDDPEARDGLATTIEHLLASAEQSIESGDAAEARRLATRILKVDEDNTGARKVLDRLTPKPAAIASPPTPASTAPLAQPVATEPATAVRDVSTLPVPVTRLTPPAPQPASAVPARQPVRVQPDPLTPRIAGTGVLPTSPNGPARKPVARRYDLPEPPALPIAGYVTSQPEVAADLAPVPVVELPADAGVQSRALEPIATPEPAYPPEAFRAGIEGWAEVDFTVNERGVTRDIVVVASEPRGVFDDAAIAAVAAWKYRPRIVNGRPLPERSTVTLRFNVDD